MYLVQKGGVVPEPGGGGVPEQRCTGIAPEPECQSQGRKIL